MECVRALSKINDRACCSATYKWSVRIWRIVQSVFVIYGKVVWQPSEKNWISYFFFVPNQVKTEWNWMKSHVSQFTSVPHRSGIWSRNVKFTTESFCVHGRAARWNLLLTFAGDKTKSRSSQVEKFGTDLKWICWTLNPTCVSWCRKRIKRKDVKCPGP